MGRKAKLKKTRKQQKNTDKTNKQYDSTQFVEQFKKMGYQLPSKDQFDGTSNSPNPKGLSSNGVKGERGNIAPEIPQDKIEPQL